MLKEYVAKRLSFLQPQGKHAQNHVKREEPSPAPAGERTEGSPPLSAELPAPPPEQPEVQTPDSPPAAQSDPPTPAEEDRVPAGLAAYEAGRYEEAWEALAPAAAGGNRDAQFLCGQMLRRELVPAGGDRPALAWYKRAAKQSHLGAQLACAAMYELGRGADMDLKRALFWYEQAAKQGAVEAQLKCGLMYFRGRAETRSPKKARRWLEAAAEGGSEEAKKILQERF